MLCDDVKIASSKRKLQDGFFSTHSLYLTHTRTFFSSPTPKNALLPIPPPPSQLSRGCAVRPIFDKEPFFEHKKKNPHCIFFSQQLNVIGKKSPIVRKKKTQKEFFKGFVDLELHQSCGQKKTLIYVDVLFRAAIKKKRIR